MLRNLSFRAKLGIVVAPPLVAILIMAWAVSAPKLGDARTATHAKEEIELAQSAMELFDELEKERAATGVALVTGAAKGRPELELQRKETDLRRGAFLDELAKQGAHEFEEPGRVESQAAEQRLDGLRQQVDALAFSEARGYAEYTAVIDDLMLLIRTVAFHNTESSLSEHGTALVDLVLAHEQTSQIHYLVAVRLASGQFTTEDYAQLVARNEAQNGFLELFEEIAGPELRARLAEETKGSSWLGANAFIDRALGAGGVGMLPEITLEEWNTALVGKLDAIDRVEDPAFELYVEEADHLAKSASNAALSYLLLVAAAVTGAAGAVVVLARSMVRRLDQITREAKLISTERLPEVLDALRNPSPEALAGALPQVHSDSTDEIGVLAESFNTVLRTSVETSIEHSQRRSQTMTNMLVNLGRRNQALIDKQLELIDRLESMQQDPELLNGLFQIDHMVTRMRRNAENLLVLASEQTARPWSEPVPMLDLLRGATSEVQAMERITIDASSADQATVEGRSAVDLSHLLAELIENATQFSPPSANVTLRTEPGRSQYKIWVIDSGLGMPADELEDANLRLKNPPDIDELSADRVGFQVVGRLARRLGVEVFLQPNPGRGLAACVLAPMSMIDGAAAPSGELRQPASSFEPARRARRDDRPTADAEGVSAGLVAAPKPTEAEPIVAVPAKAVPAKTVPAKTVPTQTVPTQTVPTQTRPAAPARSAATPKRTPGEAKQGGRGGDRQSPATGGRQSADAPASRPGSGPAAAGSDAAGSSTAGSNTAGTGGLAKRRPGAAYVAPQKAAEVDSGQFRRLPVPDAPKPAPNAAAVGDDEDAAQRLQMLNNLRSGVTRGREQEPDEAGEK
ncbi:MAG: nitrate- and nitrite sensing domain-containing protein [Acidimicrobiales bacterium]